MAKEAYSRASLTALANMIKAAILTRAVSQWSVGGRGENLLGLGFSFWTKEEAFSEMSRRVAGYLGPYPVPP